MQCMICGNNTKGYTKTCNACLSKGFKWCNMCKKAKPLSEFYVDTRGTRYVCLECKLKHGTSSKQRVTGKTTKKTIKCNTCRYGYYETNSPGYCCQYIIMEGKRRDCPVDNCTKYTKKGKMK